MIPSDRAADREAVLDILSQSDVKLTAQAYIKKIKKRFSISTVAAKKKIHQLIDEQELSYHYLYGSTYIEKSFLKPVSMAKHFILKPLGYGMQANQNTIDQKTIEIIIEQGISFGSGQHPTTQLCLEAIEFCFCEKQMDDFERSIPGADIGTGSGILAIAMCLSGLSSCNAYEIDPVSINEAVKNIAHNLLEDKINLIEEEMKENKKAFSLICANLRFPTLVSLSDTIYTNLMETGIAIISGVREWEKEALVTLYLKKGFASVWQKDKKKWSAFVFVKKLC